MKNLRYSCLLSGMSICRDTPRVSADCIRIRNIAIRHNGRTRCVPTGDVFCVGFVGMGINCVFLHKIKTMSYNLSHRKSPRARWHDYTGADYFVTFCTKNRELYFGDVVDGQMDTHGDTDTHGVSLRFGPQSGNLPSVVRGIKSAVTKYAIEHDIPFAWQSRYHDHIIRNQLEMNRIADYIENNPLRWELDRFYKKR